MEKKRGFHPIIFVAPAIFFACIIYICTKLHFMTPLAGGIAMLVLVALPHYLGMKRCLEEGNNVGGIIMMGFCGFWLFLGTCLIIASQGGMTIDELNRSLLPVEAGLTCIVFFFLPFYWAKKHLWVTLLGLGIVLATLSVSKFVIFYRNNEKVGEVIEKVGLIEIAILACLLVWMEACLLREEEDKREQEADRIAAAQRT